MLAGGNRTLEDCRLRHEVARRCVRCRRTSRRGGSYRWRRFVVSLGA